MTTTYSANKGYALQGTGDNTNTWGALLNTGVFEIIDKNLGGKYSVDVSGSADVTPSTTNAQNIYHDLYGTLTGNINYVLPNSGGFYIINNRASGAFTITLKPTGGTGVVCPVGKTIVFVDSGSTNAFSAVTFATPTDGTVTTAKIVDANVTYEKIQNVSATKRALGRNSSGAGTAEELTVSQILDWTGSTAFGDILVRGPSTWDLLPAGTNGYFLKTRGAGTYPIWDAVSSPSAADQAAMEAASSTSTYVSPGRMINHPGMAKAWAMFDGTVVGTNAPISGLGITSITRNSTGNYTANFSTNFSSANYAAFGFCEHSGGIQLRNVNKVPSGTYTTSAFQFGVYQVSDVGSAALVDSSFVCIFFFGDQ